MVPFGKQQEILRDLSTSSPEERSGNCRETVYWDSVVVISNAKVSQCYKSNPLGRKIGYQSADIEQAIADTFLNDRLTS
jgi:hypothetical protein